MKRKLLTLAALALAAALLLSACGSGSKYAGRDTMASSPEAGFDSAPMMPGSSGDYAEDWVDADVPEDWTGGDMEAGVGQVADAVKLPVIAAGGIADGRGFAAAVMLGAEAVQMGTRFVVAKESVVHENYKKKILAAKDIDSEVTGLSHGHPVRQIRNSMTREYLKLEKDGASFEELEHLTLGALRKAVVEGDTVNGTLMAGQIAGMIKEEKSCAEIIQEIMRDAQNLLK